MSEASNNPKSNIRLISERRSLDGTELTLSLLWWFNTLARFTVLWLSQTRTNRLRYTLWLLCNDFISIGIFLSWRRVVVSEAVRWGEGAISEDISTKRLHQHMRAKSQSLRRTASSWVNDGSAWMETEKWFSIFIFRRAMRSEPGREWMMA